MNKATAALLACLCWAHAGEAGATIGLSSRFVDVVIEGLRPGRTYNLREVKGVPYTVINRGSAEATVVIEVVHPKQKELAQEYLPVPDPSWIQVNPNRHVIQPDGQAFSDLIVTIPDDPSLEGKHFQAMVWSHHESQEFFAAGIKSRLRFSIGPGPETIRKQRAKETMMSLNFDIWPPSLYVNEVPAGKKYDVKKKAKKTLKVTNRAEDTLLLRLNAASWPSNLPLPEGYEAADPSWLRITPQEVKVKGNRVKDCRLQLEIPEEHAGKNFAFRIEVLAGEKGMPLSTQNFIYVKTQAKAPARLGEPESLGR